MPFAFGAILVYRHFKTLSGQINLCEQTTGKQAKALNSVINLLFVLTLDFVPVDPDPELKARRIAFRVIIELQKLVVFFALNFNIGFQSVELRQRFLFELFVPLACHLL
jgi:hypothetical protein